MNSQNPKLPRYRSQDYLGSAPFSLYVRLFDVSEVAPHDHDFLEIALVVSGSGTHGSLRGEVPARAGDVYILRPGAWHSYSSSRALRVFNCVFSIETLQRGFAAALHDADLHHLFYGGPLAENRRGLLSLHLGAAARGRCVEYLEKLAPRANTNVKATDENAAHAVAMNAEKLGYFLLFLGELARVAAREKQREYSQQEAPRVLAAPHPAVAQARQLLENDLARDWSLRELAAQLHLDRFHLSRLFKSSVGLPPMAYLARLRAERAAQLLLRSDAPISQIGAQVGWRDANLFSRRFSAHFGLSAREYRRKLSVDLEKSKDD